MIFDEMFEKPASVALTDKTIKILNEFGLAFDMDSNCEFIYKLQIYFYGL